MVNTMGGALFRKVREGLEELVQQVQEPAGIMVLKDMVMRSSGPEANPGFHRQTQRLD